MGAHGGHSPPHALKIISSNATSDQRAATPCPAKMDTPILPRRGQAGARDWRGGQTVIRMMWRSRRGLCCFRVGRRRNTTSHRTVQVRNDCPVFEKNSLIARRCTIRHRNLRFWVRSQTQDFPCAVTFPADAPEAGKKLVRPPLPLVVWS